MSKSTPKAAPREVTREDLIFAMAQTIRAILKRREEEEARQAQAGKAPKADE